MRDLKLFRGFSEGPVKKWPVLKGPGLSALLEHWPREQKMLLMWSLGLLYIPAAKLV